uniref:Uncharacterized protein n=1 Tax=Oryza sativa subsp. japonica TaxID=39947 RepID=Q6ZKD2_ORYSJ|nr:hypothetical protein [Oryza sativa Japonica Group]
MVAAMLDKGQAQLLQRMRGAGRAAHGCHSKEGNPVPWVHNGMVEDGGSSSGAAIRRCGDPGAGWSGCATYGIFRRRRAASAWPCKSRVAVTAWATRQRPCAMAAQRGA